MNEKWLKLAARKCSYPQLSPGEREKVLAVIRANTYPGSYSFEQQREILAAGGPVIDRL